MLQETVILCNKPVVPPFLSLHPPRYPDSHTNRDAATILYSLQHIQCIAYVPTPYRTQDNDRRYWMYPMSDHRCIASKAVHQAPNCIWDNEYELNPWAEITTWFGSGQQVSCMPNESLTLACEDTQAKGLWHIAAKSGDIAEHVGMNEWLEAM